MYVELHKNEYTWYKMLGYLRYRIRFNPERTRGMVVRETFYTFLVDPNGNRYALYLNRNDDGSWNWNYNWLDNDRNANNPAVGLATLFISLPLRSRRVFFLHLSEPTT